MWPLYIIFIILVGLQKRARIVGNNWLVRRCWRK